MKQYYKPRENIFEISFSTMNRTRNFPLPCYGAAVSVTFLFEIVNIVFNLLFPERLSVFMSVSDNSIRSEQLIKRGLE